MAIIFFIDNVEDLTLVRFVPGEIRLPADVGVVVDVVEAVVVVAEKDFLKNGKKKKILLTCQTSGIF